jgi:hypothetical protein
VQCDVASVCDRCNFVPLCSLYVRLVRNVVSEIVELVNEKKIIIELMVVSYSMLSISHHIPNDNPVPICANTLP